MPLYDYECRDCGSEFEAMRYVEDRHTIKCNRCDGTGVMVMKTAPRLDPKMGLDPSFPTAAFKWRASAERRGRGEDMTSANKDVADDGILRDAHADRAKLGKNKVFVT